MIERIYSVTPMVTAYIALGSNVGERLCHLQQAIEKLKPHLKIQAASAVYETAPMYVEDQAPFLNAAIRVRTDLSPAALLKLLKQAEKEVGRLDRVRYGPREVDLDLIGYGDLQYRFKIGEQNVLQLPHPRLGERRFVLQPLHDLNPKLVIPSMGSVAELLRRKEKQAKDVIRKDDAVLSI